MMKYGEADPSAPGVILRSFEEQGLHRRSLEKEEAEDYRLVRRRGQWMCFILALAAISAGTACAVAGYPIAGVSIAVPTLLGVSVVGGIGMLWRRQ